MKNNIQISTAIDYPSARFHLGHAYEKICTDALARWYRLNGSKVHFSTGTDCHGLKIQRAAEKANKKPLNFVKEMSAGFKELCKVLNISYDDFIMTIEPRHKRVAQLVIKKIYDKGEIYKGYYEGLYCIDCETFYTEKDLVDGKCPVHKKEVEKLKEESYFFKLSKYQDELIKYIKKHKDCIWPEKKRKEILNRLKEPLRDLSISRKEVKWGIPLPFDKKFSEFVWIEALCNYLTTVDYPHKKFKEFWPAIHIIGSDIVWHHSTIWFSLLRSIGLELPRVIVHGFINVGGEKLSKAKGLIVDPIDLTNKYSVDALRYFLLREIPFGDDGDFSEKALVDRYNGELANELGNLVSRSLALIEKYANGKVPSGKLDKQLEALSSKIINSVKEDFEKIELHKALEHIWEFIRAVNKYVQDKKPWEKPKDINDILYSLAESLRIICALVYPFIPSSAEELAGRIGLKKVPLLSDLAKLISPGAKVKKGKPLFPRREYKEVEELAHIAAFKKLDIRVGKILDVQDFPEAKKPLYKLKVDFGPAGVKWTGAGIKPYYSKEELSGKHIVAVINFPKRRIANLDSEFLTLAAVDKQNNLELLEAPGSKPGDSVYLKGVESAPAKQASPNHFEAANLRVGDNQKAVCRDKVLRTSKEEIVLKKIKKGAKIF